MRGLGFAAAAALVLAAPSANAEGNLKTGYALEQACRTPANGGGDAVYAGYCLGYLAAALNYAPCTPPGTTIPIGVAQEVFLAWARRNPARLAESAAAAVNDAFREAWGCGR
jgi:hypothetical protein